MPIQNHLLQRAYALAEKKKFKDVSILLNAVIQENPNNIEAWEFNLNIFSRDRNKLEELGGRINNSELIDPQIKEEVLVYYKYLLNRSIIREDTLKMRRQNLSRIGIGICTIFAFTTPLWVPREIMEIILRFVGILIIAVAGYFGTNWLLKKWFLKKNDNWEPSPKTLIRSYALDTQLSFLDMELTPALRDKDSAPDKKPTQPKPERNRKTRKTPKLEVSPQKENHCRLVKIEHSKRPKIETRKTRSPKNPKLH
jgi:hypothetical protein